tara:strand:+ start:598 stop:1092 length:495 start_codon:yes stop_codon:yes gene_type:complete
MIQISCEKDFEVLINQKRIRNILKAFMNRLFEVQRGISVFITNDAVIHKLNKQFRKKDSATDILSWTYDLGEVLTAVPELNEFKKENIAGELVISAEHVIKQASENGWDFETELIRLLAHGCAHIAGWDHEKSEKQEKEMLKLEIELLKDVGLNNIYKTDFSKQ